jgi:hypothetical protein
MPFIVYSSKNAELIIHNEFIFRISRINQTTVNWICTTKTCRATGCSSTNYIENPNSFVIISEHNHLANVGETIRIIKINEMKRLIRSGMGSPRDIVHTVLRASDLCVIDAMGDLENLYRMIRDYKVSIKNPKPYIFE